MYNRKHIANIKTFVCQNARVRVSIKFYSNLVFYDWHTIMFRVRMFISSSISNLTLPTRILLSIKNSYKLFKWKKNHWISVSLLCDKYWKQTKQNHKFAYMFFLWIWVKWQCKNERIICIRYPEVNVRHSKIE